MAWTHDQDYGRAIKTPSTSRFVAWADFDGALMATRFPGTDFAATVRREVRNLTGPEVNTQTLQWKRQGASRCGMR